MFDDLSQNAAAMVRSLNAIRRNSPKQADQYAQAHLHAFINYHETHFGAAETLRILDEIADREIIKALAR